MNNGRDKLSWSQQTWDRIDQAVRNECKRIKVTSKFLPMYQPMSAGELTAQSESIESDGRAFFTDEAAIVPLTEIWVEFTLTPQQVAREEELRTAVTFRKRGKGDRFIFSDGRDSRSKRSNLCSKKKVPQ